MTAGEGKTFVEVVEKEIEQKQAELAKYDEVLTARDLIAHELRALIAIKRIRKGELPLRRTHDGGTIVDTILRALENGDVITPDLVQLCKEAGVTSTYNSVATACSRLVAQGAILRVEPGRFAKAKRGAS